MEWKCISIPKFQRHSRGSLGTDKHFHPTFYWACDYLSMQGLKLTHLSQRSSTSCDLAASRFDQFHLGKWRDLAMVALCYRIPVDQTPRQKNILTRAKTFILTRKSTLYINVTVKLNLLFIICKQIWNAFGFYEDFIKIDNKLMEEFWALVQVNTTRRHQDHFTRTGTTLRCLGCNEAILKDKCKYTIGIH